jgi:hypothetical protein
MSKLSIHAKFGITPNSLLNNPSISLKAKGLFAFLQSKPEGWDFSVAKIQAQVKEGKDSITEGLKELELAGYLIRDKIKNNAGQWDCDYTLFDSPQRVHRIRENRDGLSVTENTYNNSKKDIVKKSSEKEEEYGAASKPVSQPAHPDFLSLFVNGFSLSPEEQCVPRLRTIVEEIEGAFKTEADALAYFAWLKKERSQRSNYREQLITTHKFWIGDYKSHVAARNYTESQKQEDVPQWQIEGWKSQSHWQQLSDVTTPAEFYKANQI